MRYVLLSNLFYQKHQCHKEILKKVNRPYCIVVIKINNIDIGIPFRSNIKHKYAYYTELRQDNKLSRAGLDYTKAVVINLNEDVDTTRKAQIRKEDYKVLLGKEYIVQKGFEKFLAKYKEAVLYPNRDENKFILANSALQYFHSELGL